MAEQEKSELTNKIEIVHILRQLIKNRELMTVSFNHGNDSISTLLLSVSPETNTLVFDGSREDAINSKLQSAGKLHFVGSLRGVRATFTLAGAQPIQQDGYTALSARLPESMRYQQHRGAFRVKVQTPTFCTITLKDVDPIKLAVEEMSVGGIQLLLGDQANIFSQGQMLDKCVLDMGKDGSVETRLEVRAIKEITNKTTGNISYSLGCRFVDFPRQHEARLSRFITQQEREIAKRLSAYGLS